MEAVTAEDVKDSSSDFVVKDEAKVFSVVTSAAEEALEVEAVVVEAVGVVEEESEAEAAVVVEEEVDLSAPLPRRNWSILASKRLASEANLISSQSSSQSSSQDSRISGEYYYPGFFEDIVPRLLDMRYGPDIAPLINTCSAARECPMKRSQSKQTGFDFNWDHDITYRAWFDSKTKVSDDPLLKTIRRKDNWLHRHMVAAFLLDHAERYEFFLDHCVPPLCCVNFHDDDDDPNPHDERYVSSSCKCGVLECNECDNLKKCSKCRTRVCRKQVCAKSLRKCSHYGKYITNRYDEKVKCRRLICKSCFPHNNEWTCGECDVYECEYGNMNNF